MSLNNDYITRILVDQRQQELRAEAANNRLARIAQGDRTPWWLRLLERLYIRATNRRISNANETCCRRHNSSLSQCAASPNACR